MISRMEIEERERSVADITEAEKYEFLQLIRHGLDRSEAARVLDYKGRHFRAICSPQSPFFDEDFANAYAETVGSPEARLSYLERLRAEATRRALLDSDRLLERLLMVHDPEWSVLRQKDVNVSVEVLVQRAFRNLPTERLEQILAWIDENEGIVEGDISELPPAGPGEERAA